MKFIFLSQKLSIKAINTIGGLAPQTWDDDYIEYQSK